MIEWRARLVNNIVDYEMILLIDDIILDQSN